MMGNYTSLMNVTRGLGVHLFDETFATRLDTTNDHLIPFTNGVLDVRSGQIRDGLPQDMLCKGPMYDYHSYAHGNQMITEMKRILTKLLPEV